MTGRVSCVPELCERLPSRRHVFVSSSLATTTPTTTTIYTYQLPDAVTVIPWKGKQRAQRQRAIVRAINY